MPRVIAGCAKGHPLKVAKGGITRPATDLVRGAIFSILASMDVDWSRVLDLYSGSGAMGIEALSRGAGWVDFVERVSRCCAIIKQNLTTTKLADSAHVYCASAAKAISFLDQEYSVIIVDPPYADDTINDVVTQLAQSKLVGADTVVVVTHSPHRTLAEKYGPLQMLKERRHGDSVISIYKKETSQ